MNSFTISQLARRSGVPASTLRYYEKVGVIPAASRSDSGYRLYDEQAVARLAFVQRAKALGVELDDLVDLVRLWDGAECAPVQERLRAMVHDQRAATRERLEELTQLATDLDAVGASIRCRLRPRLRVLAAPRRNQLRAADSDPSANRRRLHPE